MTVSLMSLLGGNVVLSANGGKGADGDAPGNVTLTSNGDAAFETVMAASEPSEISVEKLRAFFLAHGAEIPAGLEVTKKQNVGQVLTQIKAAMDGKKLPGDLVMALQEILPRDVLDTAVQNAGKNVMAPQAPEGRDWFAQLPERELTPEELSELVQETGLPPIVIFAALQNTPAASPNLAYAMGEDMGMEPEAWQPAAPVQQAQKGQAPDAGMDMARMVADMMQKGLPRKEAAQLSGQLAAVDFAAMNTDKQDVLKRIVDVLRGEKAQGEFDWSAKPVAANSNQPVQSMQQQPAKPQVQASTTQPAQVETGDAGRASAVTDMLLDGAEMKPQVEKNVAPAAGNKPQVGQPPVPQATEASSPAAQPPGFAATLEGGTALRGLSNAVPVDAQLRQAAPQANPVTEQVEVHLRNALSDGSRRMEIHLKPAELGRVDVRIDTDADGKSHVTVTADKRDTLDMLQRDVRGLERALADAGLKADSNSLSFNLRGGDGQQQAQGERQDNARQPKFDLNGDYAEDMDAKLDTSEMALTYDAERAYRLNVDWGVDISV